jgi:branched-chain amino acid transport system substrate-binding protein
MRVSTGALMCLIAVWLTPAKAADHLTIGVVTTTTGPGSVIGREVHDGMALALDELGGKVGGVPTTLVFENDQQRPEIGRQVATKLIDDDKVDILAGVIWSNVLMAVYDPIIATGKIFIGTVAGPSPIAGEKCAKNYFTTAAQQDTLAEAMGSYLQNKSPKAVYLMAPNYQAGKDFLAGFKRYYKGNIIGESYTPLNQTDFAAELTQLRNSDADAVFVFYPGALGIQFVKQFFQAGLNEKIKLYSAYTVTNISLPAIGESANGAVSVSFWADDLVNETNAHFVKAFQEKYKYLPSEYAMQNYDAIRLLDSAVRSVGGKIDDRAGLIAALEKADFKSARGTFSFGKNHFPILDYYLVNAVKNPDGKITLKMGDRILSKHADAYGVNCKVQ